MRWALPAVLAFTAPAAGAGLLAPTDQTLPPLRITHHAVEVEIRDQVALTGITQTFHNDTNQRLEATYVFPLPELADLTGFEMTFNGKMVKGEVLPADQARQVYESIVRRTKDPGLIEFIGRRLLQMRVFPIEPASDTTIRMKYQQVTRPISGMSGYHYPLRTSKTVGQAYGTVRFGASIETRAPLKNVWSPTHAVEIVREGEHRARVAYEASGGSLEQDFMLLYDTDASDLGLSVVAHQPDPGKPGHFVLMLTPRQLWPEAARQPQDVVFVIDTSGSMSGDKIEQARRSLAFCIDQLGEADRFDVVRFSTGFDDLLGGLVAATRENRARAQRSAESFSASGGTNIDDALAHVFSLVERGEADAGRPFVIVFLTDGQGNRKPEETLALLAGKRPAGRSLRIFPFGVGHDVNTILLDRLAGDYAGRTTYVQPGENLELVLGDFFSVVSQPVLTALRLALPAIGATEQFPATLGDLYHGQQIVVAARYATPATGPVTLTAMRDGREVTYTWPDTPFRHTPEAVYVPAVWAGRKIAYLIDQIRAHGENQEMIAEVVALSREHGIQTPYTSWLVAPEGFPVVTGVPWQQGPARRDAQLERLRQEGVFFSTNGGAPASGRFGGIGGGGKRGAGAGESITFQEAADAVTESAGKAATVIARENERLRDLRSVDESRLAQSALAALRLGGRWYNRIGEYLVDQDVDEKTQIELLRFGSEAYFELVQGRADLRPALAASRHAGVIVAPGRALLVADDEGIEGFSAEQRKQIGLEGR